MSNDSKPPPLWEFVSLADYRLPGEPAGESVRKGFSALWRRLAGFRAKEPAEPVQKDLEEAGGDVLGRLAPSPTWESAADALGELRRVGGEGRTTVLVGAPWDGTAETVRLVAQGEGWSVLEAPGLEEILKGDTERMSRIQWEAAEPLAIPRLEGFFLRQFDGMDLVRRLLQRLIHSERPCLLGCGSWAWAFLCKSERLDEALPAPLTLGAFDDAKLGRWFRALADEVWGSGVEFRKADNGKPVLPVTDEEPESEQLSLFLKRVAALSRGHPGVAIEVWRRSLRINPSEDSEKAKEQEVEHPNTVWVSSWSDLKLPQASGSLGRVERFLLHALLIHDGLGLDALRHTLPLGGGDIPTMLAALRRRGLIEREGGVWRVTAAAYPSVRQSLKNEDFLTDSL